MSISNEDKRAFEDVLGNIFQTSGIGGDEQLLKTGIEFTRQFSAQQVRTIIYIKAFSLNCNEKNKKILDEIVKQYLVLKQYHRSADYVRAMFDSISAKRFFGQDAGKINVMRTMGM